MNVAFVQHAQDDVDRDECGKNQQRLIPKRVFESACAVPWNFRTMLARHFQFAACAFDFAHGFAERDARRQIERDRGCRKLSLPV